MTTPLDGLRVIELASGMTNAQLGQMLADFGADVVQLEPPGGTPLRRHPSYPLWGRGKRSLVLDLKSTAGADEARRLIGRADVVLEAWRPGVAAGLGLDAARLTAAHERLVWSQISAFGADSPFAAVPGYEGLVMAKLGAMWEYSRMTERPGPAFLSVPYASWSAVQVALHGILAALYDRETTGRGQIVDTSLALALAAQDPWHQMLAALTRKYPDALVGAPPFTEEGYPASPFPLMLLIAVTRDGHWLQFSQVQPRLFQALLEEAGLAWIREDPAWRTAPAIEDVHRRVQVNEMLIEAVRAKTLSEWQEVFERNSEVSAEVFRRGTEVLHHPQFEFEGQVVEIVDPVVGPTRQPAPLVHLGRTSLPVPRPAPLLGEGAEVIEQWADRGDAEQRGEGKALPLSGVTVLELGTFYAAPYGVTLLTDLGARVIKVEPLEGDPLRMIASFPEAGAAKVLQGKESLALDMATPEGVEIVKDLARRSDLVVQSFRAGVVDRLGLDADSLLAVNPDLVYLDAPGYGTAGPYGKRAAFAPTISAGTGISMRNMPHVCTQEQAMEMSTPDVRRMSVQLTTSANSHGTQPDGVAALAVATALLLGLYASRRGAGGQRMLTTMLLSATHALSDTVVEYDGKPEDLRVDPEGFGMAATYRLYETADGWVFLAAPTDRHWLHLTESLARWGWTDDPGWSTEDGRRAADAEIAKQLAGVLAQRTAREWERELVPRGIGCVVAETAGTEENWLGEFGSSHGWLATVDSPIFDQYERIGPLVHFSRSATQALAGCALGQHTDAILHELGISDERIADLRSRSVIGG
ncbi:MAG TPA: CoA transferase [Kineosporiaceae bacterium]